MSDTALWRAVIWQALDDASRPLSSIRHKRMDQMRAREWFTQANRDFEQVCELADIDASHVRKHALPLIERAMQRDRTPGGGSIASQNHE